MSDFLLSKIETAPTDPGCYIFKSMKRIILYIGKAKNIRRRVRQYFREGIYREPKIDVMIPLIRDVEFVTVKTESDALVLETNLIKKYKPKFNSLMKDDKQYAWIKVTNEEYPKIIRVREKKKDSARYFGPFPNGAAARETLILLRRLFPYRVCNKKIKVKSRKDDKMNVCLDYHLNLCSGPCDNLISKAGYNANIDEIVKFLKGHEISVIKNLTEKMHEYSLNRNYENAASIRDSIGELTYITQKIHIKHGQDEKFIENRNLKEKKMVAKSLLSKLRINCSEESIRFECYDVSNIQGTSPIASMVVFINGTSRSSLYRFFNIKRKDTPDDFGMISEALERRVQYLIGNKKYEESFSQKPDLIIVDGGKGQLSSVLKIINKFEVDISVIGLAKKKEEIFIRDNGKFRIVRIKKNSKMQYMLQNLRDEAHRFAISRHRNLRSKKMTKSVLAEIPGIGEKTTNRLLTSFKDIDELKSADFESINAVIKNKSKTGQILGFFR